MNKKELVKNLLVRLAAGASGNLQTIKDGLIDELLKDPLFKVTKDGKVLTRRTSNGQGVQKEWREAGHVKKVDGYRRLRYNGHYLFAHRIVYRKFKGPLRSDMTIRHLDNNPLNNRPSNLAMGPHSKNNEDKWEKYYKEKKKAEILNKVLIRLR